jgi:mono/diheme cytochrome c family protein
MAAPCALAQDRAAIDAGAQVYADNCAICHGDRLINNGTAFDLRQLRADERPRFDRAMADGKGQMPAWEGVLSDEEIEQVWAYIRSKAVN